MKKFTVIIPTRERADVLLSSIKTVVLQDYDNLNIIISDNFSNDATQEIVKSFDDPRIQYVNPGKRLSMSHHWEFALSHVNDGWVTILGDDDGLLPSAIDDINTLLKEYKVEAIQSKCCYFSWPSISRSGNGRLRVNMETGYEIRNSKKWLKKLFLSECTYKELPTLYTGGFFDVDLINRARKKGKFFRSQTPDVYTSILSCSLAEEYLYSKYSFAMTGASHHSNGMSSFSCSVQTNIDNTPLEKFLSEKNIELHKKAEMLDKKIMPPSLEALVYESFLQVKDAGFSLPCEISDTRQIINTASSNYLKNDPLTKEWIENFASTNEIELREQNKKIFLIFIKRELIRFNNKIKEFSNQVLIDEKRTGLKTIYDACIVAASIRETKVSALRNFLHRALRTIKKTDPY